MGTRTHAWRFRVAALCSANARMCTGGLLASQADSRMGVGAGVAILISCCVTGLSKGRKLCCRTCGSAHGFGDALHSQWHADSNFSAMGLMPPNSPASNHDDDGHYTGAFSCSS